MGRSKLKMEAGLSQEQKRKKAEALKAKQDSKVLKAQADTAGGTAADIVQKGKRKKKVAEDRSDKVKLKQLKKVGLYWPTHALAAQYSQARICVAHRLHRAMTAKKKTMKMMMIPGRRRPKVSMQERTK
jgi:hypothetical protein